MMQLNIDNVVMLKRYNVISIIISINKGDLMDEGAVLEWLIENRSTGDEDDVIEDVDIKSLETMIQSVEQLAVLFCKLNIDINFKFSISRLFKCL